MNKDTNSRLLMTKFKPNPSTCFRDRRSRYVSCHGSKIAGSQQTVVVLIWRVWFSCAWLKSGTKREPILSSVVRQCHLPSLSRKMVELQKFCYHGNVTSNLSSLLCTLTGVECGKGFGGLLPSASCYVASYLNIESRNVCYSHGSKTKV